MQATIRRRSFLILPPLAAALPGCARAAMPPITDAPGRTVSLQCIARQLHPNVFADVDPVAELRRYHQQFLPVTFEDCWMARVTPARA